MNEEVNNLDTEKCGQLIDKLISDVDTEKTLKESLNDLAPEDRELVMDVYTVIKRAEPALIFGGVPVAREGDIVAVKGAEKVGKSQFASLVAAAVIAPRAIGGQLWVPNGLKMIIIDTEQSEFDIMERMANGIRTAAHEDAAITNNYTPYGEFVYVRLYGLSSADRLTRMMRIVATINPHIVYIDGLVQLMQSFNDDRESGVLLDTLKKMSDGDGSHKRVVIGVVHSNPTDSLSPEEKKMRGHIGTMLAQTARCTLNLSRDADTDGRPIFTAKTSSFRSEIEAKLSFSIQEDHDGSFFEIQEDPKISALRKMLAQVAKIAERDKQPLTRTYIAHTMMAEVKDPLTNSRPKRTTAFGIVKRAISLNLIEEHDGQLYINLNR